MWIRYAFHNTSPRKQVSFTVAALCATLLSVLLYRSAVQPVNHSLQGRPRLEAPNWQRYYEEIRNETRQALGSKGAGPALIWYGDSISEEFRGTSYGLAYKPWQEVPAVYQRLFAHVPSAVWAISGDTAANLLWRIQNGNGPAGLNPAAMVVLIGTNDLSRLLAAQADDEDAIVVTVARGVLAVVEELLLAAPKAQVLLMGLLPRGDRVASEEVFKQPSKYTPLIAGVNLLLGNFADQHARISFQDCGPGFLQRPPKAPDLVAELMPDALHPSAAGIEIYLECIIPSLQQMGVADL